MGGGGRIWMRYSTLKKSYSCQKPGIDKGQFRMSKWGVSNKVCSGRSYGKIRSGAGSWEAKMVLFLSLGVF